MGGDAGLSVTLPACKRFLKHHEKAELLLVGQPDLIEFDHPRAHIVPATEVVTMDDNIEIALRRKKDSSMRQAIMQVRDGAAHAAISAGNTGALMALARFLLKTLPGIDRPAIATQMPNVLGEGTTVLDLGANVDCTPAHLLQFAVMGSALVTVEKHKNRPTVGLLNIGEELIKGNEIIKNTGDLLRNAHNNDIINFYGNVEGNDIFSGVVDIVVCDGFVGNIALKTSEGLASMISSLMRAEFSRNIVTKMMYLAASSVIQRFKKRVDHRRYNGAALLGLKGLVFKSHGSADAFAFEQAMNKAYQAVEHDLLSQVQQYITKAEPVLNAFSEQSAQK